MNRHCALKQSVAFAVFVFFSPDIIMERIREFSMGSSTVTERQMFFKDAMKIFSDNPITGIGGNCWQYVYPAVQQKYYRTEQAYMTHAVGLENVNWWPSDWVQSFKRSCLKPFPLNYLFAPKPPKNARILCFHGRPNPPDAIAGYKGRHLNTFVKPCPWVEEIWKSR